MRNYQNIYYTEFLDGLSIHQISKKHRKSLDFVQSKISECQNYEDKNNLSQLQDTNILRILKNSCYSSKKNQILFFIDNDYEYRLVMSVLKKSDYFGLKNRIEECQRVLGRECKYCKRQDTCEDKIKFEKIENERHK